MNIVRVCILGVLGVAMLTKPVTAEATNSSGTNTWVNVATLEQTLGLCVSEKGTNGLVLSTSNITFEGTAGSRSIKAQGTLVFLNGALAKDSAGWHVGADDVERTLSPLVRSTWSNALLSGIVLLDAGHGGDQDGAKVEGVCEKTLTLDVVQRMKGLLEAGGVKVNLSRAGDDTVTLDARPAMISSTKSDLMVSVHFNHAENPATSGIETYLLTSAGFPSTSDPGDPREAAKWVEFPGNACSARSLILAYEIHRALIQATGAVDRGVKRARFAVLRTATAPAILVECGFMSNSAEFSKIKDPSYRDLIAKTLADVLVRLLKA
jgi:N-acetylmuramoyl-L-alanine amidase